MKNKMKFKIGEFSKLCQVTVKTLRHYEEIGLMIPVEVDEWTGYRYYDISQLRCMSRIVYLKQLGFSLEEISELFADGKEFPDAELLKVKIERCKNEIEHLIWRQTELAKLENLLHKQENVMEKVFKKSLPSRIFATHRRKIDSYQELFNLCPNIIGPEMYRLGCECPAPPPSGLSPGRTVPSRRAAEQVGVKSLVLFVFRTATTIQGGKEETLEVENKRVKPTTE